MTEPTPQNIELRKTDCSEHEKRLSKVENVTSNLQILMESVDAKVDKILEKVNRIDLLELKHATQKDELAKVDQKIKAVSEAHDKEVEALISEHNKKFDEVGKKIETLSIESRAFVSETKGMAKMAWYLWSGIGATTFLLLVKVLFFTSNAIKIGM